MYIACYSSLCPELWSLIFIVSLLPFLYLDGLLTDWVRVTEWPSPSEFPTYGERTPTTGKQVCRELMWLITMGKCVCNRIIDQHSCQWLPLCNTSDNFFLLSKNRAYIHNVSPSWPEFGFNFSQFRAQRSASISLRRTNWVPNDLALFILDIPCTGHGVIST